MKGIFLILIIVSCMQSCKDYLNLIPKGEKIVSNVDDVRSELLSFWVSHTYSSLPIPSFGQASVSLPLYNDVNAHWAMYEDNLDMLHFNEHSDINSSVMDYYYENVNWKGIELATSLWRDCYSTIGLMNTVIDDLASVVYTQAEFETIDGEARVVRAFCIFKLMQYFAPYHDVELGIPLNLDSENVTPGGRRSQIEIYDILERELLKVLAYTTAKEKWNFFYSPDFIKSLLTELYMFRAGSAAAKTTDWELAEKSSAEVIENYVPQSRSELLTELFSAEDVEYNTEHEYCALKLATKRFCSIGQQVCGIWGMNNAQRPNLELLKLYTADDIRFHAWFNQVENEGKIVTYVSKPKITSVWQVVCDILVLYRKADIYLMNLEAKWHLGKKEEAIKMLETFRKARIQNYSTPIQDDVLSEILLERRRELCFENGSRWLDMKRYGISVNRIGYSKENKGTQTYSLESDDYRYALPIPLDIELNYNNIEQNPEWTDFN